MKKEKKKQKKVDLGQILNYFFTFSLIILLTIIIIQKYAMTPNITLDCQDINYLNTKNELRIEEHNFTIKKLPAGNIGGKYDEQDKWSLY